MSSSLHSSPGREPSDGDARDHESSSNEENQYDKIHQTNEEVRNPVEPETVASNPPATARFLERGEGSNAASNAQIQTNIAQQTTQEAAAWKYLKFERPPENVHEQRILERVKEMMDVTETEYPKLLEPGWLIYKKLRENQTESKSQTPRKCKTPGGSVKSDKYYRREGKYELFKSMTKVREFIEERDREANEPNEKAERETEAEEKEERDREARKKAKRDRKAEEKAKKEAERVEKTASRSVDQEDMEAAEALLLMAAQPPRLEVEDRKTEKVESAQQDQNIHTETGNTENIERVELDLNMPPNMHTEDENADNIERV